MSKISNTFWPPLIFPKMQITKKEIQWINSLNIKAARNFEDHHVEFSYTAGGTINLAIVKNVFPPNNPAIPTRTLCLKKLVYKHDATFLIRMSILTCENWKQNKCPFIEDEIQCSLFMRWDSK